MAFFALHPELDANMPISSVLWHVLFWGCTSNRTILPDAFGSAAFKAMLVDLGLISDVTMARQDSVGSSASPPSSRGKTRWRRKSRRLLMWRTRSATGTCRRCRRLLWREASIVQGRVLDRWQADQGDSDGEAQACRVRR